MKVRFDKKEDILLVSLSNKRVDDSYETENSVVSVDGQGEPVTIEMFGASKFVRNLSKAIPKEMQKQFFSV